MQIIPQLPTQFLAAFSPPQHPQMGPILAPILAPILPLRTHQNTPVTGSGTVAALAKCLILSYLANSLILSHLGVFQYRVHLTHRPRKPLLLLQSANF